MDFDFQHKLTQAEDVYIIDLSVPAKEVNSLRDKMFEEMAKVAQLPGFRPGKVPVSAVKQKFTREVNEELAMDLTSHLAVKAARELKIEAGFRPKISTKSLPSGVRTWVGKFDIAGNFLVTVESQRPPLVDVSVDFELAIAPPSISADIDEQLHHLRHDLMTRVPKDTASTRDDEVVCSIKIFSVETGEEETDLRVTRFPFSFDLKAHSMLSDALADLLVGVTTGQDLSFVEGDVRFEIHIDAVNTKVLPDLTDELAVTAGFESLADLRAQVQEEWITTNALRFKTAAHGAVRHALFKANAFDVPQSWIDTNINAFRSRLGNLVEQLGMTEEAIEEEAKIFAATDYLLELICSAHRETDLTEADIHNYAAEEVSNPAHDPEDFLAGVHSNGQYQMWLESAKKKKALDWLIVKNNKKVKE